MNESLFQPPDPDAQIWKVYVCGRPRLLGLFHIGPAVERRPGIRSSLGLLGLICQVGPCKCGNPTHTFPRWYSTTPCIFVQGFGWIVTMKIPDFIARALFK